MSLPTADDLFRPTTGSEAAGEQQEQKRAVSAVPPASESTAQGDRSRTTSPGPRARRPSGRVRHDEKMTVYVTAEELLDIEHARLALRRDQGLAVDRGRLVREALAIVLADLEHNGDDSDLVKRLIR